MDVSKDNGENHLYAVFQEHLQALPADDHLRKQVCGV